MRRAILRPFYGMKITKPSEPEYQTEEPSNNVQSGTPAKHMASARGSSSVPKENVPANTGTAARVTSALRPKAGANDATVADLSEQVHAAANTSHLSIG